MKKNLLIVCAGDESLHRKWFAGQRSYDILTIYFGDDEEVARSYEAGSDYFFRGKGLKIHLAREILLEQLYFSKGFDFEAYGHVWFPDDDLEFPSSPGAIEDLFSLAGQVDADVFQPAIANQHYSKGWESTRSIPGALAHRTNIVEIMAFGFSGPAFTHCLLAAIHILDYAQSGWGIAPVITKCGEVFFRRPVRTFVLDAAPIIHTRPVGSGASAVHLRGRYEVQYVPQKFTNPMKTLAVYQDLGQLRADASWAVHVDKDAIEQIHDRRFGQFRTMLAQKRAARPGS